MTIVDCEIDRAPQDMDVRAWRARVLMWSGRLAEAEVEYHVLLAATPHDPDNWLGLARVYSREGRPMRRVTHPLLRLLSTAVRWIPNRRQEGMCPRLAPVVRSVALQKDSIRYPDVK